MSGTIESQLRYHAKHPDTPPPLRGLMLRAVEELRYRAMVIEQRNAEIKRGHDDFVQAITDPENQPSQWGTVTLALAQQGAQQPVAWYEYNQDLDAWFLAYGHNPKAKTRPLVFGDTAAPAPQPAQDKSDNYLSGYCTGRTDLLKEQSAQPVAPQQASTGMMYIEQAAYAKAKERYGVKAVKMRCQGFDLALPIIEESDGYVVVADTRPAQTNRTLTDAERLERERERERERNR